MLRNTLMSAALVLSAVSAQAATIPLTDSDFSFTGAATSNSGNCPVAAPCFQLTGNTTPLVMEYLSGQTFTITSFMYSMQGNADFTATASDQSGVTGTFTATNSGANTGALTATPLVGFSNITQISFDNTDTGAVRIEGFIGTAPMPAVVPLPAGILLMLTALGGTVMVGRRKRA